MRNQVDWLITPTLVADHGFEGGCPKAQTPLEISPRRVDMKGKRDPPEFGNFFLVSRGKGIKEAYLFENPDEEGLQKNKNPPGRNPRKHGNPHGKPGIISPFVPVKMMKGKKIDATRKIQNRNHHTSGDKPSPLLQMIRGNLHVGKKPWEQVLGNKSLQ